MHSNCTFRSCDLGVMGPARFPCAKLLWRLSLNEDIEHVWHGDRGRRPDVNPTTVYTPVFAPESIARSK